MPSAAYIAPIGWQVFAGLIFPVVWLTVSSGTHSSIGLTPFFFFFLPWRGDQFPCRGCQGFCDITGEVYRTVVSCIGAAVVIGMELFRSHAHLVDDILVPDPRE